MRVLISGDRDWTDRKLIRALLRALPPDTVVIQGGAKGADMIAAIICDGIGLKCKQYDADWDRFGKAAGPLRNQQMLDQGKPDVVFAFHNDLANSRGTADMVTRAVSAGIETWHITETSINQMLVGRGYPARVSDVRDIGDPGTYWENMAVSDRVALSKSLGMSGRMGSASWKSISIETRDTLTHAMKTWTPSKPYMTCEDSVPKPTASKSGRRR